MENTIMGNNIRQVEGKMGDNIRQVEGKMGWIEEGL